MLKPRPKKCRACRQQFQPRSSLQFFCSHHCADTAARAESAKQYMKRMPAVTQRKPKSATQKAQDAFNAFIRERDHGKPCIVHGHDCPNVSSGMQAGHFQGVGRKPELRFNTWNCHGQCATSNQGGHKWSRYSASVDALYERGLRERIGDERVDWLMGPHEPKQYRDADLERIRRIFNKRARWYRARRQG